MTDKPRTDLEFDAFINIDLNRAMRSLQATFQKDALNDSGLSLQEWRSLLNLARFGDSHLRELARLASLDATHTSRAALGLEKKGLIKRYEDTADSRRMRLAVTAKGHALVDDIWSKALALDDTVKAKIGKTRYKALKESLKLIMEISESNTSTDIRAA